MKFETTLLTILGAIGALLFGFGYMTPQEKVEFDIVIPQIVGGLLFVVSLIRNIFKDRSQGEKEVQNFAKELSVINPKVVGFRNDKTIYVVNQDGSSQEFNKRGEIKS